MLYYENRKRDKKILCSLIYSIKLNYSVRIDVKNATVNRVMA